jgi:Uma2 family endonuclease
MNVECTSPDQRIVPGRCVGDGFGDGEADDDGDAVCAAAPAHAHAIATTISATLRELKAKRRPGIEPHYLSCVERQPCAEVLPLHAARVIDWRGMSIHEIVLPETKPETEWVRGRALQKVSPTYTHARLQLLIGAALSEWSDSGNHGRVGSEWRFRVAPPGKIVRPLVPDVSFLSYAALAADTPFDDVQLPLGAPTVAVEILSPDDRRRNVEHKIAVYLSAGTEAVVVVDPRQRTIAVHDRAGVRMLRAGDTFEHTSLPGFSLDVGALFARLT